MAVKLILTDDIDACLCRYDAFWGDGSRKLSFFRKGYNTKKKKVERGQQCSINIAFFGANGKKQVIVAI